APARARCRRPLASCRHAVVFPCPDDLAAIALLRPRRSRRRRCSRSDHPCWRRSCRRRPRSNDTFPTTTRTPRRGCRPTPIPSRSLPPPGRLHLTCSRFRPRRHRSRLRRARGIPAPGGGPRTACRTWFPGRCR
ncbi:unnamed protein product, partial [Ectocarpus sp. 13 AM-2016]